MPLFLLAIGRWLLSKAFLYIAAALIAVGVLAFWIFAKESVSSERVRVSDLQKLEERAGEVYGELTTIHGRLVELGESIQESRKRIDSAMRAVELLNGILKRIERMMTMSPREKGENEKALSEAESELKEQTALLDGFVREQSRLRIDRTSLTLEAEGLETAISKLEDSSSQFVEHIEASWKTLKPYLIVALASVILVPIALKLFAYYVWAPCLGFAGPIRLTDEKLEKPRLLQSGVSAQVELEDGQRLWVKESYLQASDESLRRKTKFVLNWSIPGTCLAAGLVEMVEFTGDESKGKVTVSPQKRAELEISIIEIPKNGRLVARPSSIAGVLSRTGDSVTIKRRWRLFHPHAWLTFQFRYFVFHGPCALVVSGVRGVRFEELDTSNEKGRRSNQVATIGFTPNLSYGVVRAETFWSYFRGYNPLFDDVFRGSGVFLCEEVSDEDATSVAKFWNSLWSGVLKILGI